MLATLMLALALAVEPANGTGAVTRATGLPDLAGRADEVAAPDDTLARIPGSALRLGSSPERAATFGHFTESTAGDGSNRRGDLRWFGATAQATLRFRSGRLTTLRIDCANVSPRMMGYVPDELRRAGYRRVREEIQSGTTLSEWAGPCHVTLTASGTSLAAEIAPGAAAHARLPAAPVARVAEDAELPAAIDFSNPAIRDSLPVPRVAFTPADPVRPRIAVDAGVFGRVQVRARVDTAGRVVHAEIARGIEELNQAALAWAAAVRFDPYHVNGEPRPVVVMIAVAFLPVRSPSRSSP